MTDLSFPQISRTRLWVELLGFYVAAPVCMAVFVPPNWLFPVLFLFMGVGILLLLHTPRFQLRQLIRGFSTINWRLAGAFTLVTAAICYLVVSYFEPGAMFGLARHDPRLLLMIMLLYPALSALPQELVFRPLFFQRYGGLLPSPDVAVLLNAAAFSLAHLMYWNVIVALMTFSGGLIFAKTYESSRNFPQTVVLHAIGGNLVFAFGLGVYFYSGNVVRPF